MNFLMIVRVALKALRKNKLRSLLTVLGVVIGVCAVITLVNMGSGAQISIEKAISGLGTNSLIIFPGSVTHGGIRTGYGTVTTVTAEDADAILQECTAVQMMTPVVNAAAQVVFQNQNWNTSILGVNPDHQRIKDWPLEQGELALHHVTRHMLQLFSGQRGARAWRRALSERAQRRDAGPEVIRQALAELPADQHATPAPVLLATSA